MRAVMRPVVVRVPFVRSKRIVCCLLCVFGNQEYARSTSKKALSIVVEEAKEGTQYVVALFSGFITQRHDWQIPPSVLLKGGVDGC